MAIQFVFIAGARFIGYPDIENFEIQMMIDLLVNMKHKYSIKENDINTISYYRNFLEHQCDLTKSVMILKTSGPRFQTYV